MNSGSNKRPLPIGLVMTGIMAFAIIGAYLSWKSQIDFILLTPQAKFESAWRADLEMMRQNGVLPKVWNDIQSIELRSEPSPARDWLEASKVPIAKNPKGQHRLKIFVIYWTEGTRYGATLEYSLVNTVTQNTIWEVTRRHKLGFVY